MRRLLAVGEGCAPTGYARAMEAVLEPLSAAFEATLFAVNHRGVAPPGRPYEVRANRLPGDRYGVEQLPALLEELEPEIVLLHGDSNAYLMHRAALEPYRRRRPDARVVAYCPVDWPEQAPAIPLSLAPVDLLVTYTDHGRATIERAFAAAGVAPPPIRVIPLGVNSHTFAAVVGRAEARRRLFPSAALDDAFLVLNANRNQRRKRVDLTMRGFALFARDHPRARLYLHMGMRDLGVDVPALADELGIADRLLTGERCAGHPHVPDERLNLIYNACDMGLNTAVAEGFGLTALEHACAGGAQVVPDHGACAELWRGAGVLMPSGTGTGGARPVSPAAVADALAALHDDPALLAATAARCSALARSPRFSWKAIAAQWEQALTAAHSEAPSATAVR